MIPGDAQDQLVRLLGLSAPVLHLQLQLCQKNPQCTRQLVLGVFQNPGQRLLDIAASLPDRDAALQQQSTNLVDDRGTSYYPALTYAVKGLQIQLIVGLDRHETHPRPSHGLGTSLCIDESFLLVFTYGFTYWEGIRRTSCPCSRRARPRK